MARYIHIDSCYPGQMITNNLSLLVYTHTYRIGVWWGEVAQEIFFGVLSLATVARQPIFLRNGPYFFARYLLLGYLMEQLHTCMLGWG
jgi:hypothetical protein